MDQRGPERSLQLILRPLLATERTLQAAQKLQEDLIELEDSLEDLPLTIALHNMSNVRRTLDAIVFSLELERLQCFLRLRHELHQHRIAYGRIPAIELR